MRQPQTDPSKWGLRATADSATARADKAEADHARVVAERADMSRRLVAACARADRAEAERDEARQEAAEIRALWGLQPHEPAAVTLAEFVQGIRMTLIQQRDEARAALAAAQSGAEGLRVLLRAALDASAALQVLVTNT